MAEIVYILTNPAMEGLVKIGKTSRPVQERMLEFYSTEVPLPFECYYAAKVPDSAKIEKALHDIFSDKRVSPKREFFRVEASRAKKALELAAIEDVTPQIDVSLSAEDAEALSENERRQPFRFSLANVLPGSVLEFTRDRTKQCTVIDDKYVNFEGQRTSLSSAASLLLKRMGYKSTQVQGPLYWSCQGEEESLLERRNRHEKEILDASSIE